jgi:plasmid stabilization system protein ParE
MRVIIEESAIADIDGLAAWVAKDSPQGARSTVEKILKTIERLNLFRDTTGGTMGRMSEVSRARHTLLCTRYARSRARSS